AWSNCCQIIRDPRLAFMPCIRAASICRPRCVPLSITLRSAWPDESGDAMKNGPCGPFFFLRLDCDSRSAFAEGTALAAGVAGARSLAVGRTFAARTVARLAEGALARTA